MELNSTADTELGTSISSRANESATTYSPSSPGLTRLASSNRSAKLKHTTSASADPALMAKLLRRFSHIATWEKDIPLADITLVTPHVSTGSPDTSRHREAFSAVSPTVPQTRRSKSRYVAGGPRNSAL